MTEGQRIELREVVRQMQAWHSEEPVIRRWTSTFRRLAAKPHRSGKSPRKRSTSGWPWNY